MSVINRGGASFQVFCNELMNIVLKHDLTNTIIYQESAKQDQDILYSEVKLKNKVILTHYFGSKIIPKDHK